MTLDKEEFKEEEKNKDTEIVVHTTDPSIYQIYLETKKLTEGTIELYVGVITCFILRNPDLKEINSYNNFLLEKTVKGRSGYCHYAMRHYVKWKIQDPALRNKILEGLITPKESDPIYHTNYLTPGRREKIIENIKHEKHRIVASLQYKTGARVGDILKLKRGAITYENYNGKVVMRIDIIGKRGVRNPKWIFDQILQEDIIDYISTHRFDEEYYFLDFSRSRTIVSDNRVFKSNYIRYNRDLKRALIKIGLDKSSFATHDWRRCIARDVYTHKDIGKDVQLLQEFLGHKSADTTMKYLRHSGLTTIQISERLENDRMLF